MGRAAHDSGGVPPHDPAAPPPQNIYDDPAFHAEYTALRARRDNLNALLEQPALRALLPPLAGLRVLDLGCGSGVFARWARASGAGAVTGVDVSKRMLGEAERAGGDGIRYVLSSLEEFIPEHGAFDLAVSSLALHYVAEPGSVLERVHEALAGGGMLVFSVEHPVCTALAEDWVRDASGEPRHWPVDRYQDTGERRVRWLVEGVVKYHRTVEDYVSLVTGAGFVLERLTEPAPPDDLIRQLPPLALERRRPPYLMIAARRK